MLAPDFSKQDGLIPVIAQDLETGEVLMLAYMNEEAWQLTQQTGFAHYYSRSRQKLWKKGESSGHVQEIKEIRLDCDADCLLIKIKQHGEAACHTGFRSCFYRVLRDGDFVEDGKQVFDPQTKYGAS